MTYLSGFNMPGAFHADAGKTTTSPSLIFRPPVASPSPSNSAYLDPTPKRKRVHGGAPASAAVDDAPASVSFFGRAAAPRHTPVKAYTLAGTLDTPGVTDSDVLGESMYSDSDYRTALGSKRSRSDDDDDASSGGAPTSLYRHNLPSSPSRGWGTAAITAVGGVVGRVWEFCKAGAFKGFYAGGGRGFAMTESGVVVDSGEPTTTLPPADDYSYNYHYHYDDYEHRVPGHFPASQPENSYRASVNDVPPLRRPAAETEAGYPYRTASPAPSIPAAKRRQTTHAADDLGLNWVLVNDGVHHGRSSAASTPRKFSGGYRSSPGNRNYTPSVTTGRRISTTPNSHRSSMPSAARFSFRRDARADYQQQPRPQSSASFASPRPASPVKLASAAPYHNAASTASTASPSQTHSYPHGQSRGGGGGHRRRRSGNIASTSSHRRTNSTASAASSRGDPGDVFAAASPRLDAEAKQLAARRKMEERDADVRISAFNKRLQDMIRQGKEALGTTVEIDDAGGDSCWVDED